MTFDASAPAASGSGLFGLSTPVAEAHVVCIPVPFEATVSYRAGTARGPAAIVAASHQVDLFDADVGRPYEHGIAVVPAMHDIGALNSTARAAAMRAIDAQTRGAAPDAADLKVVNDAGDDVNRWLIDQTGDILRAGKIPVVLGGDHSVPYGAIAACAAAIGEHNLGILHLDAHCDLRDAYEGFTWSHASIMRNVVDRIPNVRLVQLGIRDFSEAELDVVKSQPGRVATYFDVQLRHARMSGGFAHLAEAIANGLPENVYLSFDIDGLDPALCPSTGTPVPGGLSFDEIICVMDAVVHAKKRIVGMDLVEVAPAADVDDSALGASWDANVAARLLYKMIGFALLSRGVGRPELPRPPGVR